MIIILDKYKNFVFPLVSEKFISYSNNITLCSQSVSKYSIQHILF